VWANPVTLAQLKSADGELFRQLFEIYAASISPREQKPEAWLRAMVAAPDYRVWVAQVADRVVGFSILLLRPVEGLALLEYMAVATERRNSGLGAELFRQTVEHAAMTQGPRLPVLLEIDSDREASSDRAIRTRREHFYRRLGCEKIVGLRYLMPLEGVGLAPEMDLMIYRAEPPGPLPRGQVKRWLETIYRDVYHCSPDDPRILQMLRPLPDPVSVE
jgi:GNAT superfamily N-acetyltransferase